MPEEEQVNPYIAFTDVGINLVLILAFFAILIMAVGRLGWGEEGCKDSEQSLQEAVMKEMGRDLEKCGLIMVNRREYNDPLCVQRWRFDGVKLFKRNSVRMSPSADQCVARFAKVIGRYCDKDKCSLWRRIRIEGHTIPPKPGQPDNWELSAGRAAVVARIFHSRGRIPAYYLGVSGRAGQAPLDKANRLNPKNERVEVVIEFVPKSSPKR